MASIAMQANGKYRISFCVDNYRVSRVISAKSMADAKRQANLLEARLRETGSLDGLTAQEGKKMKFADLFDDYLHYITDVRSNGIKPKTHQKYVDIFHYQLEPYFKGCYVNNIKERDIEEFIRYLRTPNARFNKSKRRGYSDGTVKDAFTLLYSCFGYAKNKLKIIKENPCDGVEKPKIEDRTEGGYYNNVELMELLKVVDKDTKLRLEAVRNKDEMGRYQPFTLQKEKIQALYRRANIYIAVYTAARRGEVLGIHRQDIDFDNKTIHFCHNVIYTKQDGIIMENSLKGMKDNTVAINDDLLEILAELIKELDVLFEVSGGIIPYTDRLFMGLNKTRLHEPGGLPFPDPYSEDFKGLITRYNLKSITYHKLRHSSISYMLYRGVDIYTVAKIAGHNSIDQIRKTYGHVYDASLQNAANVFNDIKGQKDSE